MLTAFPVQLFYYYSCMEAGITQGCDPRPILSFVDFPAHDALQAIFLPFRQRPIDCLFSRCSLDKTSANFACKNSLSIAPKKSINLQQFSWELLKVY